MAQKKCFVIAPIGDDTSPERGKVNSIIKDILIPTLGKDYDVFAAHQITKPGIITSQIVEMIFNCDLIVCDLTGVNGNVMYELAIAHLKEKQVLIIAAKGTKLPFDISQQRTIFYDDNISGSFNLKADMEVAISKIKDEPNVENPITAYLSQNRTSLISEKTIQSTIKEAIFDAVKTSQSSESSGKNILETVVKNLDTPGTDKIISSYIQSEKQFNAERFYSAVCNAIETNSFPVKNISFEKDFAIGTEKSKYIFDYLITTKEHLFLIKIANTVFRMPIQKDAYRILYSLSDLTSFKDYPKEKIQPIVIIPSEMINAGKLVAKKVPLLKYEIKSKKFVNWNTIVLDFGKFHK